MIKTVRENSHLFWALAILTFALVMTLAGPKNKTTYEASYDQGQTAAAQDSWYNLYDFEEDIIGKGLQAANRRQGEVLYGRNYVYENLAQCSEDPEFVCAAGERYFTDPYGCGCERDNNAAADIEKEGASEAIAYPVIYGEAVRLRLEDSIELNAGDTLWVREFKKEANATPQVIFNVYIAGEDVTYQYPEDAAKLLYELELVASDYFSYVEVIVRQKNLLQAPESATSTPEIL